MHRPLLRAVLALIAAFWAVPGPAAQSPAQRRELERFRDSLAAFTEVAPLRALEGELIARARQDRDNPMLHLRLGFLALRLGDLTTGDAQRRHYDEAGSEFEWAVQQQPTWPYGWYGLGFAELGVGDSELPLVGGVQAMLGRDALSRSANAFAKSAEVDPGFVAGLAELSSTALRQRVNARMDVALAALRRASRTPAATAPAVLLARGRVERAAGSLDSSAAALRALRARDTASVVARYELARTGFLQGEPAATALWYAALAAADSTTLALVREDLAIVMADSVLAAFDAATGFDRATVVRTWFEQRDDDALHARGERLAEHYRRLDVARRNYRLVSERRQYGIAERYRSTQGEYDDRGVIYVRHGEPDQVARYNATGIEPNESWLYRRESGNLLFHFVAREDVQDFRLVESLFDVFDYAATVAMRDAEALAQAPGGAELLRHIDGLLRSREPLDPIYSRLMGAGQGGNARLLTEERRLGAQAIREGTTSDSWPLDLGPEIDATVMALAVGSGTDGPRVQLAYAIPGTALPPRTVEQGFAYPVRLRASVVALDGTTVATLDTTRSFLTREPVSDRRQLLGRVDIPVPPGTFTIRMAVQTDRGGVVSDRDTLRVASPLGPEVGISDLALGARSINLPWAVTPRDTAWINPTGIFRRDEPAQLYFEVTGMAPGSAYRVELEVRRTGGGSIFRRLFGGGGAALELGVDRVHPGGVDRLFREIALDRLEPGEYRFQVAVHRGDDRPVRRERRFLVVE